MQTNQCFNNHWTFSASELCQAQVYRRNVYQRNGLPRVFPGAKGGREKFQGSEPWGVDLAQHMYYDLWILIMICAKLQSYKVTIFSAENAQMERLPAARAVRPNTDLPTYAFNFGGVVTYDKKLYYLWEARRWVSDGDLLPPPGGRRSPSETHRQVWIETAAPANKQKKIATRHILFTPPAHCLHPQIAKSTNLDHIPECNKCSGKSVQYNATPHLCVSTLLDSPNNGCHMPCQNGLLSATLPSGTKILSQLFLSWPQKPGTTSVQNFEVPWKMLEHPNSDHCRRACASNETPCSWPAALQKTPVHVQNLPSQV